VVANLAGVVVAIETPDSQAIVFSTEILVAEFPFSDGPYLTPHALLHRSESASRMWASLSP
jgi:hypothetical protein